MSCKKVQLNVTNGKKTDVANWDLSIEAGRIQGPEATRSLRIYTSVTKKEKLPLDASLANVLVLMLSADLGRLLYSEKVTSSLSPQIRYSKI